MFAIRYMILLGEPENNEYATDFTGKPLEFLTEKDAYEELIDGNYNGIIVEVPKMAGK